MVIIANREKLLESSEERELVLEILESGLNAIQIDSFKNTIFQQLESEIFKYKRVFLLGIGKGAAVTAKEIEKKFLEQLTAGWVIDVNEQTFEKIKFVRGTHPLPSEINFNFTKDFVQEVKNLNLTPEDLFIIVIFGGGSALFTYPANISLEKKVAVNQSLLKKNANIYEMNIVRKHLSLVKGGGLAKILYPAKIISFVASDVPGDDLSTIASGPIVKDNSTLDEAWEIITRLGIDQELDLRKSDLIETPKDDKYFSNVEVKIIVSNSFALKAMMGKAESFGFKAKILTTSLKGNVKDVSQQFLSLSRELKEKEIILAGGETTVEVVGRGQGGRNQELCLWFLKGILDLDKELIKGVIFVAVNSDGWDNTPYAGALVDEITVEKVKEKNLSVDEFLSNNDSYNFFRIVGDGIETGRLKTNVSDIYLLAKLS